MPACRRKKPEQQPFPTFETEAEEREFWETHDTTASVDWRRGRLVTFPDLRPSTTTISLRLPAPLLAELKALASFCREVHVDLVRQGCASVAAFSF